MDVHKLSALLTTCTASTFLAKGKVLHAKAIALGVERNLHLCKILVDFYVFFRLFDSACLIVETVENQSEISLWNGIIAAYSKKNMFADALRLYDKLLLVPRLKPDCYTYPSALKACSGLRDSRKGRTIHASLMKSGFSSDVVACSSVVGMYAKCGYFDLAIKLFDEMPEKDVACWNTVISCYYQDGQTTKALMMFEMMISSGFQPDSVSLSTALSVCARLVDLETGMRIHERWVRSGYEMDEFVSAAIVDMYGKCGCIAKAREIFESMPLRSVVAWNSMINGYALQGDNHSCLNLFSRMKDEDLRPTASTISSLLIACSRTCDVWHGKFIHGYVLRNQIEVDIFITTSLIDLYFKCGRVGYSESIFQRSPRELVVLWNVMISGYVSAGYYFEALDVFHGMKLYNIRPDAITYTSILSACAQLTALQQGKEIHEQISSNGLESNEVVMCALVEMYAKCGAVRDAREVFDKLSIRDTVSWTSMIMAYGSNGQISEALDLFEEMKRMKIKPDRVTFLALMSACNHGGMVDEGAHYFFQMTSEYGMEPGLEHYSCMIDLLGRSGRLPEAYGILQRMPVLKADSGLVGSFFSACRLQGNLELGEEAARLLIEMEPHDHSNYIALSNMYAQAGRWDEVRKVRAKLKEKGLRKNPGCSWIEIEKKIHQFFVEDFSHQQIEMIYECLSFTSIHMDDDEIDLFELTLED
ncbi:hypothetical protein HPP92_001837 [Vanilla planifolia]|uniref:Pentatricopeptide repeat-containing protein n=1 Tax=Vanilla planifolia TaxID=51239 RepID=A0A835RYZ8_VANPL|nr:hypothetical protein HPP92_001837 [Vanilla planifolia]